MSFRILVGIFACLLSVQVQAESDNASYESVLTPGARLIMGDSSKSDFYILDKEEASPDSKATKHSPYTVVANKMIPHIKTALNNEENQLQTNKLRTALHRAVHRNTSKLNRIRLTHSIAHQKPHQSNKNVVGMKKGKASSKKLAVSGRARKKRIAS